MKISCLVACAAASALGVPASAAVTVTSVGANLLTSPFSFSFQGVTFTFSATNDLFTPLTVQNAAGGAFSAFGGFLGIPLVPSTSFVDRGVVTYGPTFGQFASFTAPTKPGATNGDNFIGLRATVGTENYYGFAYTTGSVLRGYGLESTPNTTITATTAVPEAATWAMMIAGLGMVGGAMRLRRRTSVVFD